METSLAVALVSLVAWIVSFAVGVLKARDWIENVSLAAMKSGAGRSIVNDTVQERHSRVEDKIDVLTHSLESVADRLETRIEALATRMEARLDRLDKDMHAIDVRLSIVESVK